MSENNLPIKLVLPKTTDIVSNTPGGKLKFFGEVTPQLKAEISNKFETLLTFYSDVFQESETIPAVGKITVKPEAIAKSHKPSDLCRNCPIIGSEDLNEIKFETESNDLVVSYYYQTLIENIKSDKIKKDISINLKGDLKKGNSVTLEINFNEKYDGEIRIALPNSLRLAEKEYDYNKYYLTNNQIAYVTFYKNENTTRMEIPLLVTLEGNYRFENIVCVYNGMYHISNSLDFTVK